MEYNINYPKTHARNLTVALYENEGNLPMIAPSSFILGEVLLKKPGELEKLTEKWLNERRKNTSPISEVEPRVLESKDVAVQYFKDRIKLKKKVLTLWNVGGDEVFERLQSGEKAGQAHSGRYSNYVRTISKIKSGLPKFHTVGIKGYTGKFHDLECTCKDFQEGGASKGGKTNVDFFCSHIAAALLDLRYNRGSYRTHKKAGLPYVPFSATEFREETFRFGGEPTYKEENLDLLLLDVLYAYTNTPKNSLGRFEIDKKLLQMPEIMDIGIAEKIYDGKAGIEVLEQSFVFNKEEKMDPRLEDYFGAICSQLNRDDFRLEGFTLEKAGTQWETPALTFEKPGISKRIICSPEIPMLLVTRYENPEWPEIFKSGGSADHPIAELFAYKQEFDERTKKTCNYTVEIPNVPCNDAILDDYAKAIREHYPGGIEGFENFRRRNFELLRPLGSKLMKVATSK